MIARLPGVVCHRQDWLQPQLSPQRLWDLLSTIKHATQQRHVLLTRWPECFHRRLEILRREVPESRRSVDWWLDGASPKNLWLGITVRRQRHADEMIPPLLQIGAAVHWLRIEPLADEVSLVCVGAAEERHFNALQSQAVNWVVASRACGSAAAFGPHLQSLRDQCAATGTPLWVEGDASLQQHPPLPVSN
jgi:hypothetical protein